MKKLYSFSVIFLFSLILVHHNYASDWKIGASMPTARSGLAAGNIGNLLYVVGGSGEGVFLNTLEIYNPTTNI